MPWFMEQISKGFFEVVNPFNQRVSVVPATANKVHTIVFWSKNFGPFIDKGYGRQLLKLGYHLFFNFTINSDSPDLEPNVPPLNERLDQLEHLSKHFGSDAVNWRFDPICYYKTGQGVLQDNLNDFSAIADNAAKWEISRCITSFMDHYPKIRRRLSSRPGFEFIDPPLSEKVNTILDMETQLAALNIQLFTCCEKDLIAGPSRGLIGYPQLLHPQRSVNGIIFRPFLPQKRYRPTGKGRLRLQSIGRHRLLPPAALLSQLPVLLRQSDIRPW